MGAIKSFINESNFHCSFYRNSKTRNSAFYCVFLSGLLPWNFFQTSLIGAVATITSNGGLIKKLYFPREILPLSFVLSNLVHFLLALSVLGFFIVAIGPGFTIHVLWLPLIMLIQFLFVLGLAFLASATNVFYRDMSMVIDVGLQAWFFLTPVLYPLDTIPEEREFFGVMVPVRLVIRWLNPMASIVGLYRDILYGNIDGNPPGLPEIGFIIRTFITALVVLLLGWWVFYKVSPKFGEEV